MIDLREYETMAERARRMGVSRRRVNTLVNQGRIPCIDVGPRLKLIPKSAPDGRDMRWVRPKKKGGQS